MRKRSDGVGVHHEKKSEGVRVHHERKSDWVKSSPRERAWVERSP